LVVVGVLLTPDTDDILVRRGVRDSKTLSNSRILDLSKLIKENCPSEVLSLPPPQYDLAYQQHGRNLTRLLAWAHAQVIDRLGQRVRVDKAMSDQFGDESLLTEALETVGCTIPVEQRRRAERRLAVAAASVVARAEFVSAIHRHRAASSISRLSSMMAHQ